eukprot:CAMPEP_0183491214 /NCGR_PEP_ID=MMETSP0370-20130417/182332_1 /TAXON_ID=268820 /ORGANISM="Peridinium aciculiferum, Strain PAER-2" /LENGTH=255 /DNA_ID=CAMNT_0025684549 /DNA_START=232 /DNA_END=997 /DNA_ORIENTATION=-
MQTIDFSLRAATSSSTASLVGLRIELDVVDEGPLEIRVPGATAEAAGHDNEEADAASEADQEASGQHQPGRGRMAVEHRPLLEPLPEHHLRSLLNPLAAACELQLARPAHVALVEHLGVRGLARLLLALGLKLGGPEHPGPAGGGHPGIGALLTAVLDLEGRVHRSGRDGGRGPSGGGRGLGRRGGAAARPVLTAPGLPLGGPEGLSIGVLRMAIVEPQLKGGAGLDSRGDLAACEDAAAAIAMEAKRADMARGS